MSSKDTVLRFTVNERIQHFLLIIAFIILFLSGFSLKYNETEAGALLIRILGGMENRSLIHRIGAILLIVTGMYHVFYVFFTGRGRNQGSAVLLRKKDFKRMGTVVGSLFSRNRQKEAAGRFTLRQKLQYWLVMLGSISMAISGLLIWFHDETISLFSKWFWDLLFIIHSQEAMLVFLVIVIWHLYDIHLRDAFPMDWSWINGRISVEQLKKEHPLEYEEMKNAREIENAE